MAGVCVLDMLVIESEALCTGCWMIWLIFAIFELLFNLVDCGIVDGALEPKSSL